MDMKKRTLWDKAKDMADKTGEVARDVFDAAERRVSGVASATKINLKIFDLRTECDNLYREIGRMVYSIHQGAEMLNDAMEAKIAQIDQKQKQISLLRQELAGRKMSVVCPCCGRLCAQEDMYCAGCGQELSEDWKR